MKKKFLALWAVVSVLIFLCSGCTAISRFEDEELRQYTETILDAVLADDPEAAYEPFKGLCSEDDFAGIFYQFQSMLGYADTYRLKLLSLDTKVAYDSNETVKGKDAIYKLNVGKKAFIVSVGSDSQRGLRGFTLSPYESTDYYSTGTLTNLYGVSLKQVLLLLSNLISLAPAAFACVDCIRGNAKGKVLWLLLILLGFFSLGNTVSASGLQYDFKYAWLAGYSALIHYGSGATTLRILVPVGAILYFIVRFARVKNVPLPAEEGSDSQL